MLITALLLTGTLMTGDPDGVVATARATPVALDATVLPETPSVEGAAQAAAPHGLTTDQQIEQWVAARDLNEVPYADAGPESVFDDREMHGEVDVGFGTDGYRSYGAAVSLPVGQNGRLDISFRQVENGYPYGYHGYGYGDPALDYSGYAFPGHRPAAAAEYEDEVMRPGGPPKRLPVTRPNRTETP